MGASGPMMVVKHPKIHPLRSHTPKLERLWRLVFSVIISRVSMEPDLALITGLVIQSSHWQHLHIAIKHDWMGVLLKEKFWDGRRRRDYSFLTTLNWLWHVPFSFMRAMRRSYQSLARQLSNAEVDMFQSG